jgi:hypothetical protein
MSVELIAKKPPRMHVYNTSVIRFNATASALPIFKSGYINFGFMGKEEERQLVVTTGMDKQNGLKITKVKPRKKGPALRQAHGQAYTKAGVLIEGIYELTPVDHEQKIYSLEWVNELRETKKEKIDGMDKEKMDRS